MAANAHHQLPTWRDGAGIRWLTATDHKRLGVMHIVSALALLGVAGFTGLILMLDTDHGGSTGPLDQFAHLQANLLQNTAGLYAIGLPIALGLAVYLVPLMIGARELIGAQAAALGFWLWLGGTILMLAAPAAGNPGMPGGGDASKEDATGLPLTFEGRQFWIIGLLVVSIGVILTCGSLLATIARGRAQGMTPSRLPVFVSSIGLFGIAAIVSSVILGIAGILFLIDAGSADFFAFDVGATEDGGYAAFYQNPIWFFANPLLYALFVPLLGGLSEAVAVFTRRPLRPKAERALVLLGLGAITALSILLSVFHIAADAFSGSFLRGIPIAIFLLCAAVVPVLLGWLDGLRSFRPGKTPPPTPLLFALGTVEVLALGAILSLVWGFPGNYNDTTSIHLTALFQGGIAGGLTLAALGCLHYWFPKITGRALDPRGALAQFGLAILGTNLLILGLHINDDGTRLVLAEAAGSKAGGILALIGFLALFLAVAGFVAETVKAMLFGRRVGNDPWEGDTLEWLATSPPAEHNFDRLPPIESARPLADLRERIAAQGRSA